LTIIFVPTKHRKISKSFYAETNGALVEDMRSLALNDYFLSSNMPCHSSSRPDASFLTVDQVPLKYIQPFKLP